jgi:hypothetical protein
MFNIRKEFIEHISSAASTPSHLPNTNPTVATWISSTLSIMPMSSNSIILAEAIPCCSKETIQALKCIRDLSKEFDIRLSVETYMQDQTARRGVLSHFAKSVFKYGGTSLKGKVSCYFVERQIEKTMLIKASQEGKLGTSSDVKRTELYR